MPTSDKIAARAPARELHAGVISVTATYTLTAALALNDVIEMVQMPAGSTVVEVILSATDLDTGGSPNITLAVGDGADTDRFITASNIGQTGGLTRLNAHTGHGYTYSNADTIDVLVAAGPATGATTGSIVLTVLYTMDK